MTTETTIRLTKAEDLNPRDLISVGPVSFRVVSTEKHNLHVRVRAVRRGDSAAHITVCYFDRGENVAVVEEVIV